MSITTRPPATAWIGVTCTDDRLRGLHRRHYSSEKSGRRRGRPVEHPNQLRMIGPGEYLALLTLDASAGQCRAAGTPVFVKQLGGKAVGLPEGRLRHRKGADPAEWPEDLRVREWPR